MTPSHLSIDLKELALGDRELYACMTTWFGSLKKSTGRINQYAFERWATFVSDRKKNLRAADKIDALEFLERERLRPGIKSKGRTDLKLCNASIYRTIAVLSGFHRHMRELRKVDENPFEYALATLHTPKPNERREFRALDNEEVRKILGMRPRSPVARRSRAMMALLFGGGLRLSEALNLKICDLRTTPKGTVYVWLVDTKAGDSPTHALPDWCKIPLWELVSQRSSDSAGHEDYLVAAYSSHLMRPTNNRLSPSRARFVFKRDCEALGIKDATPHCARHTAITHLAEQDGITIWDLKQFARHSSIRTTERYLHSRTALDEAAGKILNYAIGS